MKNFFVPTGELIYLGTKAELANVIYSLYGKMDDNGDFQCSVSVPRRKRESGFAIGVPVRVHTTFRFCGSISHTKEGFKIIYKVHSAYWFVLSLIVPVYLFFQTFFAQPAINWKQLIAILVACAMVSVGLIGFFLILRRKAIRQFVKIIEEDNEDYEGIFN